MSRIVFKNAVNAIQINQGVSADILVSFEKTLLSTEVPFKEILLKAWMRIQKAWQNVGNGYTKGNIKHTIRTMPGI